MKLGLKLWSTNTDYYFEEAKKLFQDGWFDYIELYVVPNTIDTIKKWKTLQNEFNIPFTLHAPHFVNGINLAKPSNEKINIEAFNEVKLYRKELNAEYIVVHSGIEGNIEETIRQLKIINLPKMLIENKPYIAPLGANNECRGATIEEIKLVLQEIGCGFCLDVGHAFCTANFLNVEPYEFLAKFNAIKPTCYHLSDNYADSKIDRHLNFGQGNYDFKKILDIIDTNKKIAIETNKNSKTDLEDFGLDVEFLKRIKNG